MRHQAPAIPIRLKHLAIAVVLAFLTGAVLALAFATDPVSAAADRLTDTLSAIPQACTPAAAGER